MMSNENNKHRAKDNDEIVSSNRNMDYPSNSYSARTNKVKDTKETDKKIVTKVTTGPVRKQKKSLGKKIAETFMSEDNQGVGDYIIHDVLIPNAKELMAEMVESAVEMILFGRGARSSGSRRGINRFGTGKPHISYNSISSQGRNGYGLSRELSKSARARHDFDEIVIPDREEANQVLDELMLLVDEYGQATVGDYYDLVGVSSTHADRRWGWLDLKYSDVVRAKGGGYIVSLPKTQPLD